MKVKRFFAISFICALASISLFAVAASAFEIDLVELFIDNSEVVAFSNPLLPPNTYTATLTHFSHRYTMGVAPRSTTTTGLTHWTGVHKTAYIQARNAAGTTKTADREGTSTSFTASITTSNLPGVITFRGHMSIMRDGTGAGAGILDIDIFNVE
jgi:hypothetical protein